MKKFLKFYTFIIVIVFSVNANSESDIKLSKEVVRTIDNLEVHLKPAGSKKERFIVSHDNFIPLDLNQKNVANENVDLVFDQKHTYNPKEDLETILEEAYAAMKAGQYEAATHLYNEVLHTSPMNEQAMFGLASIYQISGQYEDAKHLYITLLTLEPTNYKYLNNFLALLGEEAPEDAINQLQKLLAINPGLSVVPAQIGMIYYKQKDYKKAVAYLKRALNLEPNNQQLIYSVALIYDKVKRYDIAIKYYSRLLENALNGNKAPISPNKINSRLIYINNKISG